MMDFRSNKDLIEMIKKCSKIVPVGYENFIIELYNYDETELDVRTYRDETKYNHEYIFLQTPLKEKIDKLKRDYYKKNYLNVDIESCLKIERRKTMNNLKEVRIDRGMTQAQVAKEVGVSLTAYIRWEQGVMNPNEENEKKLKEVLKIESE